MPYVLIGALVGLAFAAFEYYMFGALIARAAQRGESGRGPRILDIVRKAQLIVFPLVGAVVAPLLLGNSGDS